MHQIIFTFQRSKLIIRFRRVETKELRKLAAVLSIFVNAKLDVLAKGLIEFGEVVLVFSNLADKVHGLLHKVLADDLEDFVLLESFTGDVKRKIFRVDDTLDEVEVLGNEVLTVVHDEYTADVEFNVIALLLGLEEIERSTINRK
jgi:hypothetical protein